MSLFSNVSNFFGLDIGNSAVRLVQLHASGDTKQLVKYAYVPIDAHLSISESKVDQQKYAEIIKSLVSQANLTTKNVAVGLPSERVFTTVVDIDHLSKGELEKSIKYQADSLIPTPLADSKIDWALIGESPKDKTKDELLLSSVSNDFTEKQLDIIESIGLNVIAFEPNSFALVRALILEGNATPQMVIDMGSKSTDVVISMAGIPRLTRTIQVGMETILKAATQNLNVDEKQAQQFVLKFGVDKGKLEGQVYDAIFGTVDMLATEIEKSIKFFQTRYVNFYVSEVIVTGGASTLAGFPLYLANRLNLNVEIGNAWRNVVFAPERQNELLSVSNQFAVAVGLAERKE